MRHLRSAVQASVLALFLGVSGCAVGGATPPSRFYLLEALEPPREVTGGVALGVGPIRLAEYLDRPQMVTRRGSFALELAEFDRWGEPLTDSISRVLAANLGALLGTERVQRHPWRDGRDVELQVELDVRRFDGPAAGPIELVAHWRLRRAGGSTDGLARLSEPQEGAGHEAQAAAMSRALRALAREIAAAARSAPEG